MGARVVEAEVAVGHAAEKFDDDGRLVDDDVRAGAPRRARDARRRGCARRALAGLSRAEPGSARLNQVQLGRLVLGQPALHDRAREHADELAVLDDRHALEVLLLEEARTPRRAASPSRSSRSAPRRSRRASSSAGRGRAATTSRTSVLRVITPTSRPSSQHEHGAHLVARQRLARLLRGRARRRARAARAPSRRGRAAVVVTGRSPRASSAAETSRIPATSAASRSEMPRSCETVPHAVERVAELLGEPAADLVAVPEEPAEVLHPLEVRDGDAAGVREHVRQDGDAALGEDRVALDRRRPVRALGDEPAAQVRARSRPSPGPRAPRARGCRTAARAAPRS